MGAGLNQSRESSKSGTSESRLSKMQADILKTREDQYQSYFFPEIVNSLNDASGNTMTSSLMSGQSAGINQSSNAAKRSLLIGAGQRGISGSGVELQGLASIGNAKSSMLSDAYNQSKQAQIAQKNTLLQMGGSMSPTPTNSAQLNQSSSGSSNAWGFNGHLW